MSVLGHLQPARVLYYFEALCAIPHGSSNTKAISDYCADFARAHTLYHRQDAFNNLLIVKEATSGYERAETVILQGHLDMVCEKTPDCPLDLEQDGLELGIDGDLVYAKDTTLGSDDGIAVAMALALLEADNLPHPRMEVVFTVDEEIGMLGAAAMDLSDLRGRKLLNLDSEVEEVFIVSCAGAVVATCVLPLLWENAQGAVYAVTVGGLQGGHSGMEIDKGRGNANLLLGRVLWEICQGTGIRLLSIAGGFKENAIPRESTATLLAEDAACMVEIVQALDAALKLEYQTTDPGVFVTVTSQGEQTVDVMTGETTRKAICMLHCLPNGTQAMSADVPGLVQTSLNMGILETTPQQLLATFCVRSSVESQKKLLEGRISCLMAQLGGKADFAGDYPGWAYRKDSPLRDLMVTIFREQYGYEPAIQAVHAGVECGLFSGKLKGLDSVSFGPNLTQIHTVQERMSISSVQRVWAFLLEVLRRSK